MFYLKVFLKNNKLLVYQYLIGVSYLPIYLKDLDM